MLALIRVRSVLLTSAAALLTLSCAQAEPHLGEDASAVGFRSERIEVTVRGSGPDLILVPGLAAHRDVWSSVASDLAHRYRLHLVQVKGFAGVDAGANTQGPVVAPVADEVARYVRETGLERPSLIGHSMGGTVGMLLAVREPDRLQRLMVVDAPPFLGMAFGPPGVTPEAVRPVADRLRKELLATSSDVAGGPLDELIHGMVRAEDERMTLLGYAKKSDPRVAATALHEMIVTDLRPDLARTTVPITVLYVVPDGFQGDAEEFESLLRQQFSAAPAARLVRVDDANHYIHVDQPARFVAEVNAFMAR